MCIYVYGFLDLVFQGHMSLFTDKVMQSCIGIGLQISSIQLGLRSNNIITLWFGAISQNLLMLIGPSPLIETSDYL